jgi:hypothetical protein
MTVASTPDPRRSYQLPLDPLRSKSARAAALIGIGVTAASLGVALAAVSAPERGLSVHLTTRFFWSRIGPRSS